MQGQSKSSHLVEHWYLSQYLFVVTWISMGFTASHILPVAHNSTDGRIIYISIVVAQEMLSQLDTLLKHFPWNLREFCIYYKGDIV